MLFRVIRHNAPQFEMGGIASPLAQSFNSLNGTSLASVDITVNLLPSEFPVSSEGEPILRGNLETFLIGGRELVIDDLTISVPEPSIASSLLIALGSTLCRRPKRNSAAVSMWQKEIIVAIRQPIQSLIGLLPRLFKVVRKSDCVDQQLRVVRAGAVANTYRNAAGWLIRAPESEASQESL